MLPRPTTREADLKRFTARIYEAPSGCWEWQGAWLKRQYVRARRVAWMLFHKDISKGQQIYCRCDNPSCVNPEHLFLGPTRPAHGEQHGRTIFTREQILAIRADTRAISKIAQAYGQSYMTIYAIKKRKSWKWL